MERLINRYATVTEIVKDLKVRQQIKNIINQRWTFKSILAKIAKNGVYKVFQEEESRKQHQKLHRTPGNPEESDRNLPSGNGFATDTGTCTGVVVLCVFDIKFRCKFPGVDIC